MRHIIKTATTVLFLSQSVAIAGEGSPIFRWNAAECLLGNVVIGDPGFEYTGEMMVELNILLASGKLVKLQKRNPTEMAIIQNLASTKIEPKWMKEITSKSYNPHYINVLLSKAAIACGEFFKDYPD